MHLQGRAEHGQLPPALGALERHLAHALNQLQDCHDGGSREARAWEKGRKQEQNKRNGRLIKSLASILLVGLNHACDVKTSRPAWAADHDEASGPLTGTMMRHQGP